ncbi:chorismate mutase [Streptosporangium sp. V21-05]|uniref:chorismate mutase n=1 Tax=Streptosporangium sp. V21-05 TaxID=3446115 RepID=UPI003F53B51B
MSSTARYATHRERAAIRMGTLTVGAGPAVVIGGPGADAHWISLRDHHGHGRATVFATSATSATFAPEAVAAARAQGTGPVLVEPSSAEDLPLIAEGADGAVVGAAWMRDSALVRATAGLGLPVLVQRDPRATLEEWLEVAGHCVAEGNDGIVLCEGGGRAYPGGAALDLALLRAACERSGRPVLAGLGADPALAAAAIAAGADGLLLDPSATERDALAAREAVRIVGALTRRESPDSVRAAREAIDRVDAALAVLLERRAELAGTIQRLKPVGGFAGRDADRERRLVAEMARRAPVLGEARLAPIMNAVIEAGLHLAEERRSAPQDRAPRD